MHRCQCMETNRRCKWATSCSLFAPYKKFKVSTPQSSSGMEKSRNSEASGPDKASWSRYRITSRGHLPAIRNNLRAASTTGLEISSACALAVGRILGRGCGRIRYATASALKPAVFSPSISWALKLANRQDGEPGKAHEHIKSRKSDTFNIVAAPIPGQGLTSLCRR